MAFDGCTTDGFLYYQCARAPQNILPKASRSLRLALVTQRHMQVHCTTKTTFDNDTQITPMQHVNVAYDPQCQWQILAQQDAA